MNHFLTAVLFLFLTTAAFAQQPSTPAQDPTALGNAFFKAMLDEDSKTLGNLVSSDLDLIGFDGQSVDGALLMQGVSGGYVVIDSGTLSDVVTRQYNNDAAVMTGTWKAKGNIQGQGFDNTVAFSLVSAKQAGTWKIVNVQFTPVR